jgi:LysM repeat protein
MRRSNFFSSLYKLPLVISVATALFPSCQKNPPHNTYSQRAYLNEQSKQELSTLTTPMNQPTRNDLRVSLPNYQNDKWERQPYESLEAWAKRLREAVENNNDSFILLQDDYNRTHTEEQHLLQQIEEFKTTNVIIEKRIKEYQNNLNDNTTSSAQSFIVSQKIPFTIHLVAKNETLYSLAKLHYGNPAKVKDIIKWNQNWMRTPQTLMAGLGLVLFYEDTKAEKGQSIVNTYIREVQKDLDTTIENE